MRHLDLASASIEPNFLSRFWTIERATRAPVGAATAEPGRGPDPTSVVEEGGGRGAKAAIATDVGEGLGRLGIGRRANATARRSESAKRRGCRRSKETA